MISSLLFQRRNKILRDESVFFDFALSRVYKMSNDALEKEFYLVCLFVCFVLFLFFFFFFFFFFLSLSSLRFATRSSVKTESLRTLERP